MRIHNIRMNATREGPAHLIKFRAVWAPSEQVFYVNFRADSQSHAMKLSPEAYDAWCAKLDEGIKIGDWLMHFEGALPNNDPAVEMIKTYFRKVNQSFKEAKAAGSDLINE